MSRMTHAGNRPQLKIYPLPDISSTPVEFPVNVVDFVTKGTVIPARRWRPIA